MPQLEGKDMTILLFLVHCLSGHLRLLMEGVVIFLSKSQMLVFAFVVEVG